MHARVLSVCHFLYTCPLRRGCDVVMTINNDDDAGYNDNNVVKRPGGVRGENKYWKDQLSFGFTS